MDLHEYLNEQIKDVSTSALRNVASIVTFSSSKFGDEVKDQELSVEIADSHQSSATNFDVRKALFGNFKELTELHRHVRATYNKHVAMTLPWKSRGARLLPNSKIPDYFGMMGVAKQQLEVLREGCRKKLPEAYRRAKVELGTAYREEDYKNLDSIPDRFLIHFEIEPIPDGVDLVMPDGYQDVQMQGLYEGVRARVARAIETLWGDIGRGLEHAIAKAENPDTKRWLGTTLTNVLEPAKAIKEFGLITDPAMLDVLDSVEQKYSSHDIKRIASMDSVRKVFAEDSKKLLAKVKALGVGAHSEVEEAEQDAPEVIEPEAPAFRTVVTPMDAPPLTDFEVSAQAAILNEDEPEAAEEEAMDITDLPSTVSASQLEQQAHVSMDDLMAALLGGNSGKKGGK